MSNYYYYTLCSAISDIRKRPRRAWLAGPTGVNNVHASSQIDIGNLFDFEFLVPRQ